LCAALNEKNLSAAKERSEVYSQDIDKLKLGVKSVGAYIHTVPNDSELFDKKT
jgi:hypothetical protein